MTNKRILYIVSEDAPGMRPYAATILKSQLNDMSHIVIVVRSEKSKASYSSLPQQNITYVSYPQGKIAKLLWHFYPKKLVDTIKNIVTRCDIDLIYTLAGEISLAYVIGQIQRKVKVLHTVHDANEHDMKHSSITSYLKHKILVAYPNKLICSKVQNLISNSKTQVATLESRFPQKKVYYVPFPTLVSESIKKGDKIVPELDGIDQYILFFGNVNLYKGVHLLHSLYVNHKGEFNGRKLVIAGLGDNYYNGNSDSDIIRLNRFIDDSEVKDLFEKASLVVYPYISATQSGVLSIASYFAKKMVVSDVPFFVSIAEGQKGIRVVDVQDELKFLNKIKEMLTSTESSKELYEEVYELSQLSRMLPKIYDEICN
ncbi:MAG: glycosyltransferase [Bacteroidales bacterium]|nr:glycosyltransferase [Bacteroidales bacterium]